MKKINLRPIKKRKAKTTKIKIDKTKKNIVHLGNVGEDGAYRSKRLANRFSDFSFYGIDLKNIKNRRIHHPSVKGDFTLKTIRKTRLKQPIPKNLQQIQTDFINGLNRFPDGHVDLISSDFSVGYYDEKVKSNNLKFKAKMAFYVGPDIVYSGSENYTKSVVNLIYKKLKPSGKFISYYFVDSKKSTDYFGENLVDAINQSPFKDVKVEIVNINKIPSDYRSFYTTHLRGSRIFRIIAKKS